MKKINTLFLLLFFVVFYLSAETIRLDQLDVTNKGTVGWGTMKKNKSIDGNSLILKEKIYKYGIGTHAPGRIDIKLHKNATRFTCVVGIDDEISLYKPNEGIANYSVINFSNGKEIVKQRGVIKRDDDKVVSIDIDVTGWEYISLDCGTENGNNWSDHVDWCNPVITYNVDGKAPTAVTYDDMISNRIVFQCLLKHYSLPNTRMMHRFRSNKLDAIFSVTNLPNGLEYDAERNLVEGKISKEGTYTYNITAQSGELVETKEVSVEVRSDLISPTPLMGWMSWNVYQDKINENNIKEVGDLLVSTGLKDVGFNYVLIDDHWHAKQRGTDHKPLYSTDKFPTGFKALTDYFHTKDLKVGIYSDAAENTCGGEFGGLNYELIDAQQYADWGFDFLKYDYCHAPADRETAKVRYKAMSDALKATGRNFFFNICEWGGREPWLWASEVGGHTWRVTWDSRDIWDHGQYDTEHCGVVQAIDIMKNIDLYTGPNQFNDADMMCVGLYGTGKPSSHNGANGMTDTEYQSQFSLWSIWSSPLLISFDLSKMNEVTKRILTNTEVIAINQDPMGQQAACLFSENGKEIYMKDLENGDIAVALLNRTAESTDISISLDKLFLRGKKYIVRDLWKHEDITEVTDIMSANVASHETKLYRIRLADGSNVEDIDAERSSMILHQSEENLMVELSDTFEKNNVVRIINVSGSVIQQKMVDSKCFLINIANLPAGLYVINVINGKQTGNKKFLINRK